MENINSLTWFYTKDELWNPYYGDPATPARLETAMRFGLRAEKTLSYDLLITPAGSEWSR